MLALSSIRMSNQNNFPAFGSMGCHRLPVGRIIIIIIIIINIAASSNNGAKHYGSKLQTNGRNE